MKDRDKDKEQLISELIDLRSKIAELAHIKACQKQTEKKLAKSEELYSLIVKNTSDVIALHDFNLQATYTYISPSMKDSFGYEPEELIGKSPFTFIHPDDKKKLFSILKNYINAKEKKLLTGKELPTTKRIELPFKDKKGNWRYVQSTGNIVGNKILFITTEITDQKKVEETLRRSHQEFISLFKSNPEAIVYVDEKSNILNINTQFTKLFGYSLEDIKSRNVNDGMIHPSDRIEEGKALDWKTFSTGYSNFETIRKKKDGTLFPVSLSGSPVIINNQVKGGLGIYIDITERKQNERLQQILYNISKATSSPITLDQLYPLIHRGLGAIIDSTNFYVALVDKKEDKILFPYYVDEKDENFSTLHLSDSNSLTVSIIKTGQPLLINYEQINQKIAQGILTPLGTITDKSIWLGVPFKIEDRVIGAMVVQSYTNPELYSEKDIKLLELISSQVATAIERKSTEEKIKHLRFHDSLTDLYNWAYFEEELERYNSPFYYPLSIVVIDVNGLKVINDTFGHIKGDRLLQHLSQILTSVSRKGDIIARIGGDEFAILLPSTTSEEAHSFCERIKKACQQDKIEPIYLRLNISLGHTTQEREYKDINSLLKEADRNMYQDKLFNGKSREKHFLEAFRIILAERDTHTNDHSQRLQELALSLGKRVGLNEYQLGCLKLLALLHDIGKIGIPDSILFKTYTLTPSEWKKMREHSRIGYRMAKNIPDFAPIAHEILCHHEHWDGKGYPDGLKGEDIPLLSRIISIVDAYDVMQSRRPYKGAISKAEALKEVKRCAGTQFDPQLVEIFLKIVKNNASRERE
jgi:diguanylate cyclase (GGDEF)-like protein/PAS domain S-box-containing protein